MEFLATRAVLPALGLVGLLSLTGCTNAEPRGLADPDNTRPVRISVTADSPEQLVLGEVYSQVLQEAGRATSLNMEEPPYGTDRLHQLHAGETDLIIGCTGQLLHQLDRNRAEELSGEIEDGDVENPSDATYRAFMGALPTLVAAPDPSPAQGCADSAPEHRASDLPQSIIPVYVRDLFDREELKEITAVTRFITTSEMEGLIKAAEDESSVSTAVSEWLGY